jgi:hypothetical protein
MDTGTKKLCITLDSCKLPSHKDIGAIQIILNLLDCLSSKTLLYRSSQGWYKYTICKNSLE